MHQKNNQAAEASSATLHYEDDDDDGKNPFADDGADFDEDEDEDELQEDDGRGSWWRGVVRRKGNDDDKDSDEGNDHDDDEEFGDFAMAGDDADKADPDNLVLKPLAVNPAKEGTRGLSGLWPFGTRAEKEAASAVPAGVFVEKPAEVKEATRRTSIEEPDEEEVVV